MTLEAKLKVIQKRLKDDSRKEIKDAVRKKLRADSRKKIKDYSYFPNEASVSQGIVLPILQELNWDIFDTKVVRPEYPAGRGKVDFALCDDSGNPKVFIEVKKLGSGTEDAEGQGLKYARRTHAPALIIVLTDGRTWSFYLSEQGGRGYGERRGSELDILKRSPQNSSKVLQRYLKESRVVSGKAHKFALRDLEDRRYLV